MRINGILLSALLVGLMALAAHCPAQEPGKDGDEALDSLIEKLAEPKKGGDPPRTRPPGDEKPASKGDQVKPKGPGPAPAGPGGAQAGDESKPGQPPKPSAGDVSGKDKELDELLERLGESKDEPTAKDGPSGRPQPGEPGEPNGPGEARPEKPRNDKSKGPDLREKDQEIDERLEELTGRRRKKKRQDSDQDGGGGQLGQIIKEMRDVEQKLGKPETGEDTQNRQKQIVKQIETLIRQAKQSGSQGQMAMRMVRQQGQKPGDKPGQQPGANPGGAPAMKPSKTPDRHATAGGKDIWGHLPAELRQEMENVFKEDALPAKEELIKRYYLSIAKQKLRRSE